MDDILRIVLDIGKQPEADLGPSRPDTGLLEDLRRRSHFNVDVPRGTSHVVDKKPSTLEETEKALTTLRKKTGQDFRRLLGKHQHVLRSEVKNLVQSHRKEILAAYADESE